jgi:amino acid adenylation domain-containing protein
MTELTTAPTFSSSGNQSPTGQRRDRISYMQEQIWIAEQLAPDLSVYGIPMVIALHGEVNADLAARCLTEIVRRHEVLRSRVVDENGDLVLVTDPAQPVDLPVLDLRGGRDDWHRLLEAAAREPFDLVKGPLLRVQLLRLHEAGYVLFLNMHHIVSDGWSLRLFWAEFTRLYSAWHAGTQPELPKLTMQYRDFAVDQRRVTENGGYRNHLDLWVQELTGAPTTLELPSDHRRTRQNTYQGAEMRVVVPTGLRAAALTCARQLKVTPFTMMAAVWGVLLARYTRQEDLLVGSPLAGRTRPELEQLIGLFVNTMPLRMRPAADKTFADFAREVQFTTLDALTRQDVPFLELAKEMHPFRSSRDAPLFQTVYSFEESAQFEVELPGCEVTALYELSNGASRFDLDLSVVDALGELSLQFVYDSQLFDQETIACLAGSYLALLGDAAAHPRRPIGRLRTSTDTQPDCALAGRPVWPDERLTLHGLFEDRARQTPDAPAVERENGTRIGYAELNRQANRLARFLRSLGLRVGGRVATALPHDSSWPTAVLAVLKAGGAYVPVDPEAPPERIEHILTETAPQFVLAHAAQVAAFSANNRALALDDSAVASAVAAQSCEDLDGVGVTGRQVAYIPFTSGSTGLPKGTLVTHTNLVSFTTSAVATFELDPADRMLQIAAMTFDVHVEEFFPTWAVGGCVVFFEGELSRTTPAGLLTILRDREVTVCELPTAYWIELVRTVDPAVASRPHHMRMLLIGGERAPVGVYQQWLKFEIPLINVYGLTETAVTSTTYRPRDDFDRDALPIGRPMPHAAVYLLDESLSPVGQGVPGEIYLGGPGVSLGLLNRPEQTSEHFLPDLFSVEPGARMYRTGDCGRWTADRQLEFLGRADRQLKIRGHRMELAEIETVLDSHPDVLQAVVVPKRTNQGGVDEIQLNAYLLGEGVDEQALAQFLRTRLPAHMVPARITVIDQFPMTDHGKVDHNALRAIRAPNREKQQEQQGTGLELRLAEVYRKVLDVESIDLHAEIFELGYHSLAALRLVSRLKSEFKVDIPIGEFFANSSIAAVAGIITVRTTAE